MIRWSALRIAVVVVAVVPTATAMRAADWPHWRGPRRDGVVPEPSGFRDGRWTVREVWRGDVGEGASSPLIVQGRVYVMGWRSDREQIVCLDAATGNAVWRHDYPCPKYGRLATGDKGLYSGPSSTPEYDVETGLLYTLGADGELQSRDAQAAGRVVWRRNLYDEFDVRQRPKVGRSGLRDYGYTSSPLVQGEALIVEAGAQQGNLIALDKRTGKQLWASQSTSPAGHNAGPVPLTVEGVPCIAVHNHDGLLVVRIDRGREGETVAAHPWETSFANNIASVTVHGDHVLLTSSYNHHRIEKLRITLAGAVKVWEANEASKVCSPVVHQGAVYWCWREVICLDWETGRARWRGGRSGDPGSCIVTADDRLIIWADRGRLSLVETARRSPDGYVELAALKDVGRSDAWPHVALADGRLYCKDRSGQILCLGLPR